MCVCVTVYLLLCNYVGYMCHCVGVVCNYVGYVCQCAHSVM